MALSSSPSVYVEVLSRIWDHRVFEVAVDDTLSVSVETRSERMSVVEIQPAPGARRSATIPPT